MAMRRRKKNWIKVLSNSSSGNPKTITFQAILGKENRESDLTRLPNAINLDIDT
jgi:hypothetical protein